VPVDGVGLTDGKQSFSGAGDGAYRHGAVDDDECGTGRGSYILAGGEEQAELA
jgi:hypothetical protein